MTTTLDVIAGRYTGDKIQGKILLNEHTLPSVDARVTGNKWTSTPIINVCFVTTPVFQLQKMESVDKCIELLELGPIPDKIIRGSSPEQMQRSLIYYFERYHEVNPIKLGYNPATIGAGVGEGKAAAGANPSQLLDLTERFLVSDQKVFMEDDLDQEGMHNPSAQLPELKFDQKRASNSVTQFDLLCCAFFRMYWRTPTHNLTRLMISVALACVFAIIYQSTDYSSYSGANAAIGLIFVSAVFMDIFNFNSIMLVAADGCTAFYRERASQTYNALWYFIAGTLVECPYIFLSSRSSSTRIFDINHGDI
ncbi:ABC transporter [Phytophthora megakarya]|uniref:ABC transporter n=1 Tax=Phytophthora megakarya TaxID=4795 RepID=A0A225UWC7_9STRA|nr:ABC transporter [Phytophthora megakarya]